MEPVDMEKLNTALAYIQRIADGKNPVNNQYVEEDAVLNNPNVIRCMYFVKDVLEEVRRNQGYIGKKAGKKAIPDFPLAALSAFRYEEDRNITGLVGQLNGLTDTSECKKLSYTPISRWLKLNGYLNEEFSAEVNKQMTMPTEKGRQLEIYTEKRTSLYGNDYLAVIYGRTAQEFIVRNMEKILSGEIEE